MNRIPMLSTVLPTRASLAVARSMRAHPRLTTTHQLPATAAAPRYESTSSPKAAEKASAESGGSRSKDAAEQAASGPTDGIVPDALASEGAKGRTGGGEPLESSHAAPAKPKIYNAAVHGGTANLTKEQQEEVDAHNKEVEKKHGKATPAESDKVDKSFWSGKGDRANN